MSNQVSETQFVSGDPGSKSILPAPAPVSIDTLSQQLSKEQITALQALAAGQSVREVAKSVGVGRSTVYKWLKQDPNFRAAFNAWKEELIESGRARLLKASDAAITTIIKAVAKGDTRAAIAMLKGIGIFAAQSTGPTDPAILRREMELDRRQQRIDLAARSGNVADDERKHLHHAVSEVEDARRRRWLEEQHKRAQAEAAQRTSKGKDAATEQKQVPAENTCG